MTLLFTNRTGPPTCQKRWDDILHTQIEWKKVWRTLQNTFSNPYDTKTWLRLVHRGSAKRHANPTLTYSPATASTSSAVLSSNSCVQPDLILIHLHFQVHG
eukprot:6042054-Pleurochrysis_carterae.AAC.1